MCKRIFVLILFLGVVGCSSGGGSGSSDGIAPSEGIAPLSGRLVNPLVQGISYRTATREGVTGSSGEFFYQSGERITFAIGDLVIWEGEAAELVAFLEGDIPVNRREIVSQLLKPTYFSSNINKLRLLAVLDEDADYSDGIQVDGDAISASLPTELAFNLSAKAFGAQESLVDFLQVLGRTLPRASTIIEAAYRLNGLQIINTRRVPLSVLTSAEWNKQTDGSYSSVGYAETNPNGQVTSWNYYNFIFYFLEYSADSLLKKLTNSHGSSSEFRYFEYDLSGRLKSIAIDYNGDGSINETVSYLYDSNGQLTSYVFQSAGEATARDTYEYQYNEDGSYVVVRRIRGESYPNRRFTYDLYDQLVQDISYDSAGDGSVRIITDFEYDELGNLVFTLNESDSKTWTETRTYDENGNLTQVTSTTNGISEDKEFYVNDYNEEKQLIQKASYPGSQPPPADPESITYYEYDDDGLLIQEVVDRTYDGLGTNLEVSDFAHEKNNRIDNPRYQSATTLQNARLLNIDI